MEKHGLLPIPCDFLEEEKNPTSHVTSWNKIFSDFNACRANYAYANAHVLGNDAHAVAKHKNQHNICCALQQIQFNSKDDDKMSYVELMYHVQKLASSGFKGEWWFIFRGLMTFNNSEAWSLLWALEKNALEKIINRIACIKPGHEFSLVIYLMNQALLWWHFFVFKHSHFVINIFGKEI